MSHILTPVRDLAALEQRIALIACGENSRSGKTQACDIHREKGAALLRITSTGALDALAAAICGSGHGQHRACAPCTEKATRMIGIYNGEADPGWEDEQ